MQTTAEHSRFLFFSCCTENRIETVGPLNRGMMYRTVTFLPPPMYIIVFRRCVMSYVVFFQTRVCISYEIWQQWLAEFQWEVTFLREVNWCSSSVKKDFSVTGKTPTPLSDIMPCPVYPEELTRGWPAEGSVLLLPPPQSPPILVTLTVQPGIYYDMGRVATVNK